MENTDSQMVMTVLQAHVPEAKWSNLQEIYSEATTSLPPQLAQTFLLQSAEDPTLWRLASIWSSRAALEEYRRSVDTPGGVLIFRAVGVEPACRFSMLSPSGYRIRQSLLNVRLHLGSIRAIILISFWAIAGVNQVADKKHLRILEKGVEAWNLWRWKNDIHQPQLEGADLQDADLSSANFEMANLSFANLQGAWLYNANLKDADLQGANLQGAQLDGANLQWAWLMHADLRTASLHGAFIDAADLSHAARPISIA